MKIAMNFFPNWTEALGWTLINSLWQGMIVMIMLIITLRLIPSRLSQVRYVMACSALALLVILNASTFIYILNEGSHAPASSVVSVENPAAEILSSTNSELSMESDLTNILVMIDRNIPFILLVWIIGALLFSLRMLSGWWYVVKLEAEASVVNNEWSGRLENLAKHLQIKRVVRLAQSGGINAPVVIGFIKPIILVPVGMFSGLSTEQIETIFIHELAHIKRCDYLINLIQSFIETVFFFNPFTWIISTLIRREREYCCDDTVIEKHGSALAYAKALTLLEEIRLSKSAFALSLAENKNQLLDRIKRLMEKSVKNYSGRERLVPALLLVVGLICASWLTIRTERQTTPETLSSKEPVSDTVIKKNDKSAQFSRKTITRYDENGEPQQEIIEEFKGDEELRDLMSVQEGVWQIPPIPSIDPIPPIDFIPTQPDIFGPAQLTHFNFMLDTIPGKGFRWRSETQWKDFSEEFEKNFKERFGDFYKTHEKDLEKMMREMEEKFHNRFNEDYFDLLRDFDFSKAHEKEVLAQIEALKKLSVEEIGEAEEQAKHAMEAALQHMEWQNEHQHQMKQMEEEMQKHSEQFKLMEKQMKGMEERMKSFEKELKKELIKDGYIGSNDEIKNIHWDDDGEIEVNGKKIKESDKEKYQKLHREYFKEGGNFRYVE